MARSALSLMEHVNLNVPDPAKAEAFFVDALGCVKNPKSSNNTQVHVNLGVCQVHMPFMINPPEWQPVNPEKVPVPFPQAWPGPVTMWVDDLSACSKRVEAAKLPAKSESGQMVVEWEGTPIKLLQAPAGIGAPPGGHPGGTARMLHMPEVRYAVSPKTAPGIAAWYAKFLGARTEVSPDTSSCTIYFDGPDPKWPQKLIFEEDASVAMPEEVVRGKQGTPSGADIPYKEAVHLAVYFDSDEKFQEMFEVAEKEHALFVNPRFAPLPGKQTMPLPHAEGCMNWQEARTAKQYRLLAIRDLTTGQLLTNLEHEVRCPSHPSFPMKEAMGISKL